MDADWIERAYQDTDDRNLDMEAARSAVSRLADMVDEFRKREATQDTIRERLRATVNAVQSLHDRLAQERPLGNAYVELLRDALRAPGGCDPWGLPCPEHGADHWRTGFERLTAERDAAVARADAAEAQTREWRHKYDVLLREHDTATTELAEAVAARDLLADSLRKMTEKSDHWEARARVAEAKRDAAVARADAAEAAVERVRRVRPSHTGCLPWREVRRALDGGAG